MKDNIKIWDEREISGTVCVSNAYLAYLRATARRLCRKGPSNFWIKYFVETEIHLNEVLSDLKKETDDEYVQNIINNLEKEYLKSPLRISDDHWKQVNDLSIDYRIKNRIPLTR